MGVAKKKCALASPIWMDANVRRGSRCLLRLSALHVGVRSIAIPFHMPVGLADLLDDASRAAVLADRTQNGGSRDETRKRNSGC
jgi:hypothetical protein